MAAHDPSHARKRRALASRLLRPIRACAGILSALSSASPKLDYSQIEYFFPITDERP